MSRTRPGHTNADNAPLDEVRAHAAATIARTPRPTRAQRAE
jgi:hypothetical protein